MRAIAIYPGKGNPHLTEIEEPSIISKSDIKAEVLQVGVCGTDRGEVEGGRADAPHGADELIIGHEMLCRVVETGSKVKNVKPEDYGVFTVRRGCGECIPCSINRSDMCLTGKYKERGIKGLHGYNAQYVVDAEEYFIKIPDDLKEIAVLTEPLSISQKAISEAVLIQQSRIPGYRQRGGLQSSRVLVAGIGAVGLLAAFLLVNEGAEVYGLDIVSENSLRAGILKEIGGKYINGGIVKAENIDESFGEMDMIIEAAGISELGFNLTDALGINGIYVMTGIPEGDKRISLQGDSLMRQIVLKNQILLGSVNASIENFRDAVAHLGQINKKWGSSIRKLLTGKVPYNEFEKAFESTKKEQIKTVMEWKK